MHSDSLNGLPGRSTGSRPALQQLGAASLLLGILGAMLWLQQASLQRQYAAGAARLDLLVANVTNTVATLQKQQQWQQERQTHHLQRMLEQFSTRQQHHHRQQQQQQQQQQHRAPRIQQHQDPNQAATLHRMADAKLGVGSRLVSFRGGELLIMAMKNDEWVGHTILTTGTPWEPEFLSMLMDLAPVGSTVVDAGANIGAFSVFLAHKVGPSGRVISFEPQRKMFQLLCANAMANSLLNIYAHHSALSYQAGSTTMDARMQGGVATGQVLATAETNPQIKINYGGMALGTGGEPVQARTLDSYNLTGIRLLKMDVQGAEPLLMYGAQATIKRELPVVAYEKDSSKHGLSVPREVADFDFHKFLLDLGYQEMPGVSISANLIMLPPGHPRLLQGAVSPEQQPSGGRPLVASIPG